MVSLPIRQPLPSPRALPPGHGSRADACPGVLDLHEAADGLLARVRIPGGLLAPAALRCLAIAATDLAAGSIDLTARGNVQLRGLTAVSAAELAGRLTAVGLLPSVAHDRVRNIVASPLTGLGLRGLLDVRRLVRGLDAHLLADPLLAELPGRFLIGLDDGSGDVALSTTDIAVRAESPSRLRFWLGGQPSAHVVGPHTLLDELVRIAGTFLDLRAGDPAIWRVRELPGGAGALAAACDTALTDTALTDIALPAVVPLRPGPVGPALVVGAPLGRLTSAQGVLLADIAEPGTEVRLTPWRSVVVPDGAAAAAACAAAGLIVSPDHALASITACSGLGECARALADVRADALAAAPLGRAAHWSACERRCGQPADALSIVAAGPASYRMGDDPQLRGPRDLGGEKS